MLPQDFRTFISGCTLLPLSIRQHLIGKSGALTSDARQRIVDKLKNAEQEQLEILEKGISKLVMQQKTLAGLLKTHKPSSSPS